MSLGEQQQAKDSVGMALTGALEGHGCAPVQAPHASDVTESPNSCAISPASFSLIFVLCPAPIL